MKKRSKAPHERKHREDYYALEKIFEKPGMTTKQLAKACVRDPTNIKKRDAKWDRKLARWVYRKERPYQWYFRDDFTLEIAQREWRQTYEPKTGGNDGKNR